MKSKIFMILAVFGLLMLSLGVLQPTQAQQTPATDVYGEGFPHTADGEGFPMVSPISIDSPTSPVYLTNQVTFDFTVKSFFDNSMGNITMTYSLDGQESIGIPVSIEFTPLYYTDSDGNTKPAIQGSHYLVSGSVELKGLQSGQHRLTIFGRYELYSMPYRVGLDSKTVEFIIDDGSSPVALNLDVDGVVSEPESPVNVFYASAGVFSLVSVAGCVFLIKRGKPQKCE